MDDLAIDWTRATFRRSGPRRLSTGRQVTQNHKVDDGNAASTTRRPSRAISRCREREKRVVDVNGTEGRNPRMPTASRPCIGYNG